ncbi:hypothetical protein OC842_000760 [Tilletia horrida]|uniref:Xylanolytic transcriptional activator regulatory domain-containing protein n=1 Tax=Tilletia horrida TaxID=155126 RepID=A0AAN6GG76_9BASI|nr:hypothetical protein OC842_000760 [Tilletia horrida]
MPLPSPHNGNGNTFHFSNGSSSGSSSHHHHHNHSQQHHQGTMSPPHSTVDTILSPTSLPTPSAGLALFSPSKSERKELISTFFNRVHPYSALFDEMSFLRDLATGESPMQLSPMYAIAARFLPAQAGFLPNAERYAQQTRRIFHNDEGSVDSAASLDQAYLDFLDRPDQAAASHLLAVAQTVLLLSAYELGSGRHQAALQHSAACIRLLVGSGLHRPSTLVSASAQVELTRSRLVSVAFTHDVVLAALADQTPTVRRFDFELAGLTGNGLTHTEHARRHTVSSQEQPSHLHHHHLHHHHNSSASHRRHSDLERSSTERLTSQLENLARAAAIFAYAFEYRRQQAHSASSSSGINLSDEINRQLCEWSDRLELGQTFNGDNVQRHGSALWSVQDSASKEWTADHSVSLGWAMMHTLCECSSVLAKSGLVAAVGPASSPAAAAELAGLNSARSNLVLLLDNMHGAGRSSLLSILPMLYAQHLGATTATVTSSNSSSVDAWLSHSLSLWSLSPLQSRKAVLVLQPSTANGPATATASSLAPAVIVVGSSYRSSSSNSSYPSTTTSTPTTLPPVSSARSPMMGRTLPAISTPGAVSEPGAGMLSTNSSRISPSPSTASTSAAAAAAAAGSRPTLLGTKRTFSATSATSSTSPHLHALAQLSTPPMSLSSPPHQHQQHSKAGSPTPAGGSKEDGKGTSAAAAAAEGSASSASSSSSSSSAGSMSSSASSVSGGSSLGARSPPPAPPVLPVSSGAGAAGGASAIFKTNTLPPLISFHKHRA